MKHHVRLAHMIAVWVTLLPALGRTGSLYRCEAGDGHWIYTDSPAQLDHCSPVSFQQPHNVANPTPSSNGPESTAPFAGPPAVPTGEPVRAQIAPPDPMTLATPPPQAKSCPPGINPLNPLSAPPCLQ